MSKTTIAYVKLVRDEHGTIIHSENADHLALSHDEAFMAGGKAMREHMVFEVSVQEWMQVGISAEREACAKLCDSYETDASKRHDAMADDRNKSPVLYMLGKEVAAGNLACQIRRRGQA